MIGVVLSCEHASWALPPGVEVGLDADQQVGQAAWDHGAYEIAARLGETLDLRVHAGAFSRTFVDLNRPPDHADVIPRVCFGVPVPGNAGLTPADRAARLDVYHRPYWAAVRHDVQARLIAPGACLHLSIHSFAPELDPARRAFDVGVLYDPAAAFEADLAEQLQFGLRRAGLSVRANQPYLGTDAALITSLRTELAAPRYAGIEIEASHAVTRRAGGCAEIAAALAPLVDALRA